MKSERLLKVEEIYHAVLETPPDDRSEVLSGLCGEDDELAREVGSLLAYVDVSSSLIDKPPIDVAAEMISVEELSKIIGTEIGHYKILSQIGVGGMGAVFLAEDTMLKRQVAIKFIKPEFAQSTDQLRRFLLEARSASSLNHPNIITIYEIGKSDDTQFIATEFIEGKTLRKAISERELSLNQTLEVVIQVATALKTAHAAKIIHRDIKPENIILRNDGLVKVLDFGLAKLIGSRQKKENTVRKHAKKTAPEALSSNLTAPDVMMGTAAYISPEQARLETIDARSDLWSLSIVLYEMVNGCQPFKAKTAKETIAAILNRQPHKLADDIPDELKRILLKGLQKNAENRYQTASEFLSDLNNCKNQISPAADFEHKSPNRIAAAKTIESETKVSASKRIETDGNLGAESGNISSAEFIFKKVKTNKLFSVSVLATLFIALMFVVYASFSGSLQQSSSFAVLPFANESGDPNLEYLSDGISESLIDSLSEFEDVMVIDSNSSFKYKGREAELDKIGRNLGVRYVLKGRVLKTADGLKFSAELVDVHNGSQIWGEEFISLDVSKVETEISEQIAQRLQLRLTAREQKHQEERKKPNPNAYELLLKGRFYQSKANFEGSKKAVEYFDQALSIDPEFAEAYADLASVYLQIGTNGFEQPKESILKAKAAAEKALALDDKLPSAHLAMAGIRRTDWDWSRAESSYRRAIELNDNLAIAHYSYAFYQTTMGQHEKAISEIMRARELSPLKPHINVDIGFIYYFARNYEKASEQYEIAQELYPDFGPTYYSKGFINAANGEFTEAIANYREMIRLNGNHTGVDCYLGFALAKAGQFAEANDILDRLESGKEYVSPVELAIFYVGLNETDKALASLERAFEAKDSQMQFLAIEPHFDTLRNDPRFENLIERVGLPRAQS